MDELQTEHDDLQRRVDDLRAFEREYRSRLVAYLTGLIAEIEPAAVSEATIRADERERIARYIRSLHTSDFLPRHGLGTGSGPGRVLIAVADEIKNGRRDG